MNEAPGAGVATVAAVALERAVNGYLSLDPEILGELESLAGKAVRLQVTGTGLSFDFCFGKHGVEVRVPPAEESDEDGTRPDLTVTGTPFALRGLVAIAGSGEEAMADALSIEGDTAVAQRLKAILTRLDVDWEEPLSHLVGDVAAHQIGNIARGAREWTARTRETFERDFGEYLREEADLTPTRAEVEAFGAAVDGLRDGVERLEKRLARLRPRATGGSGG